MRCWKKHHFVSNAVDENVPVTDFIQSDYTFINQDQPVIQNGRNRRDSFSEGFPDESMRELLGQPSILTLTANGGTHRL